MLAALALRFALELGALAAMGWWGWRMGGPLLAVALVVAVAAAWGALLSPRAAWPLPWPVRALLEAAVWVAAVGALVGLGAAGLAAAFSGVLAVDLVVLVGAGEWQRPGSSLVLR